ncbi:MAG: hypothetical protein IJP75_10715 [Bacteroidaceae bacterium]|nr:hypothetical protein [Bacteroidaceae bacterium]
MMKVDKKFTQSVVDYLEKPRESRSIEEGAMLLLRMNGNRMLHQNILRRKNWDKLEYELKKHLKYRIDGLTLQEVQRMNVTVMPKAASTIKAEEAEATHKGKRADHDQLPADIQQLYDRNGELFPKIKATYNTLLQMESAEPCDRYEHLKVLAELDREYRENWNRYDAFTTAPEAADGSQTALTTTAATPKEIAAARKYLSEGKKKLATIEDGAKRTAFIEKMQQRVSLILTSGEKFDADYQKELEGLGLTFS